jgi:hypothetical protein
MLRHTVTCVRPETPGWSDAFGNTIGETRPALTFHAVFAPPTTQAGSQIVDGVLRETTVTKPALYADDRSENADAFASDAIVSGDSMTVAGDDGWEVDGEPAVWASPQSGRRGLVVELRRTAG